MLFNTLTDHIDFSSLVRGIEAFLVFVYIEKKRVTVYHNNFSHTLNKTIRISTHATVVLCFLLDIECGFRNVF